MSGSVIAALLFVRAYSTAHNGSLATGVSRQNPFVSVGHVHGVTARSSGPLERLLIVCARIVIMMMVIIMHAIVTLISFGVLISAPLAETIFEFFLCPPIAPRSVGTGLTLRHRISSLQA